MIDYRNLRKLLCRSTGEDEYDGPENYSFTPDEFCAQVESLNLKSHDSYLHINSRSLSKNYDAIHSLLDCVNVQFSAIGLTEIWIKDVSPCFIFNNYKFLMNARHNKRGGGVGVLLRDDLKYTQRKDLDHDNLQFESIFIEIQKPKKNILLGVVYRPPDQSVRLFLEQFELLLNTLRKENKVLYLMGDFNINLFHVNSCQYVTDFLDLLMVNSIYPMIHFPTRITENSCTLIDNIFTNNLEYLLSGTIISDISDHLPIFLINNDKTVKNTNDTYFKRDFSDRNIKFFAEKLSNIKWTSNSNNVNKIYDCFLSNYVDVFNECFPLQEFKKRKKCNNPWFTNELRKKCKRKCQLYKKYIRNPTTYRKDMYKTYRNKVNNAVKRAKSEYFKNKFQNASGNIKKIWKLINSSVGKSSSDKTMPDFIVNNDSAIYNKNEICSLFNEYFINIGPTLNNKQDTDPQCNDPCSNIDFNERTAFFKPITPKEIIDIVSTFKNDKSSGYDDVNIKLLKKVIHIVCYPLSEIFNLSLSTGIVPDKLKIAKVIPVFKSGTKESLTNYRPISLLPVFSKILERAVYNRLLHFLTKCNIITGCQYGFRPGHSTSHAIIHLINNIIKVFENNEILIGLFLDLSKAFDTLDHEILIKKLYYYGIRGVLLEWFKSYLKNRAQFVQIGDEKSEMQYLRCGVPQGSILGPLLFIIYVNDMCNISNKLNFILFADDTSVFMSNPDIQILNEAFTRELSKLFKWLSNNKLVLNYKKTNYMIFTKKKIDFNNVELKVNEHTFQRAIVTKFLGVLIDHKLTWNEHTSNMCNKIAKNIGILRKVNYFPPKILKLLYHSFLTPYFSYCTIAWANSSKRNLDRLLKLQKKAIRIVSHAQFNSHTKPLFNDLKILNVIDIGNLQIGIFMYLCFTSQLPNIILHYFNLNTNIHNYSTRNAFKFHYPKLRTTCMLNSIFYKGPRVWNNIPPEIRSSKSINVFKRKYKNYLLNMYNVQ